MENKRPDESKAQGVRSSYIRDCYSAARNFTSNRYNRDNIKDLIGVIGCFILATMNLNNRIETCNDLKKGYPKLYKEHYDVCKKASSDSEFLESVGVYMTLYLCSATLSKLYDAYVAKNQNIQSRRR